MERREQNNEEGIQIIYAAYSQSIEPEEVFGSQQSIANSIGGN
ncbi:MAG: hypothetical protein WC319_02585 [Candidatus Paceibacterota bacterium]|jgi:hypothetical protein